MITRSLQFILLASVLVVSGCFTLDLNDGMVQCNAGSRPCPAGYYCAGDGLCYHNGHTPPGPASCTDGQKNGDEADVDCGGSCPACAVGQACSMAADCTTSLCQMNVCTMPPPQCTNGVQDPGESDVDCGGSICPACAAGKMCGAGSDCLTMMCNSSHICFDQCKDGMKNGDETDVDCGGSCKTKCVAGQACGLPDDCATQTCNGGYCIAASGPPNWIKIADYPAGFVQYMSAATLGPDGVIYMFGGCRSPDLHPQVCGEQSLSSKYDPIANSFTPSFTLLPNGRAAGGAGLAANGKIYLIDGFTWDSTAMMTKSVTPIDAYDPSTNTWSAGVATTPNGTSVFYSPTVSVGASGEIYAFGGYYDRVNNPALAAVLGFLPTNNTIDSSVPSMPYGVWGAGSARGPDGNLYVLLGGCRYCANPPDNYSAMVYSETTKMWGAYQKPLQLPTLRGFVGSALAGDGRIYIVGGAVTGTGTVATVEAYTPKTNNWATVASLSVPGTWMATATASDGRIFALGGVQTVGSAYTFRGIIEAYGPIFKLVSTKGSAGSSQGLTGSNFAANATVSILFGTDPTPIATAPTDASGQIMGTLVYHVPTIAPGVYRITAVDNKSNYPVYASFTVQ